MVGLKTPEAVSPANCAGCGNKVPKPPYVVGGFGPWSPGCVGSKIILALLDLLSLRRHCCL